MKKNKQDSVDHQSVDHQSVNHQEVHSVTWQWLETPLGPMLAKWRYQSPVNQSEGTQNQVLYLTGLWFKDQKYFPNDAPSREPVNPLVCTPVDSHISAPDNLSTVERPQVSLDLEQWLSAYFLGDVRAWDLLCTIPLKPEGSDFQTEVWALLLQVPYGQTRTYGELAKAIAAKLNKSSFSAQAVGGAVGRNPISILIPCHRIVGAQGALTGYAGGVDKKSQLLLLENANSSHFVKQ